MKVLVPRRIIGWGVLLAVLCLLPVSYPPAYAKPIGWEDKEGEDPPAPKGDGDGVVVKAASIQTQGDAATTWTKSGYRNSGWSWMRYAIRLVRLGFNLRLFQ